LQFVRPPLFHNICVNGLCFCTAPNLSHALPYLNGSVYYCRRKGCGKREAKSLLEKLRWVTLGYHYDWNSKVLRSLSNVLYCMCALAVCLCIKQNVIIMLEPLPSWAALQQMRFRRPFPIPPHSLPLCFLSTKYQCYSNGGGRGRNEYFYSAAIGCKNKLIKNDSNYFYIVTTILINTVTLNSKKPEKEMYQFSQNH